MTSKVSPGWTWYTIVPSACAVGEAKRVGDGVGGGVLLGVTVVLDDTATVSAWEVADASFEAGEIIELYLTTSGWTPTSADIQAMLEVALT